MVLNVGEFRTEFPEFSDSSKYTTAQITFWGTFAEKMVPQDQWGDTWQMGVKLFVAHELVLASQNAKAGKIGGVPGSTGGIPNAKTVGSVSVSYDSASVSEIGAGFWNLTNYGKQLWRLAQMFGAGCIQL
jgi:hypothetical protein